LAVDYCPISLCEISFTCYQVIVECAFELLAVLEEEGTLTLFAVFDEVSLVEFPFICQEGKVGIIEVIIHAPYGFVVELPSTMKFIFFPMSLIDN
jgi:hypothetical protein